MKRLISPVRAFFTQGRYGLAPRPAVPVRSFTAQASFNDGKTWHVLDSTDNVDGNGNILPISSPLRDHIFDGMLQSGSQGSA